jgi:hypothetical protein
MGPVGQLLFLIGAISTILGVFLLYLGIRSRGSMNTQWGNFEGPVWFILIAFGLVLEAVGVLSPF